MNRDDDFFLFSLSGCWRLMNAGWMKRLETIGPDAFDMRWGKRATGMDWYRLDKNRLLLLPLLVGGVIRAHARKEGGKREGKGECEKQARRNKDSLIRNARELWAEGLAIEWNKSRPLYRPPWVVATDRYFDQSLLTIQGNRGWLDLCPTWRMNVGLYNESTQTIQYAFLPELQGSTKS